MNKMIGISLMVLGCLSFFAGLIFYSKPAQTEPKHISSAHFDRTNNSIQKRIIEPAGTEQVQVADMKIPSSLTTTLSEGPAERRLDLRQIIEVAIADGVLTQNEKKLIKKLSLEQGLDHKLVLQDAETELLARGIKSETEVIDQYKKAGDDFEKFVVMKFDRNRFDLLEWTGDKYVEGRFSERNYHPDLILKLKRESDDTKFAVECKWRSWFAKEIVIASEAQITRYKQFQRKMNMPVFVAVGIGGTASKPQDLYIIPLEDLNSNKIAMVKLKQYQQNIEDPLRFNSTTKAFE